MNCCRTAGWQILSVNTTISSHIDFKYCQLPPTIMLKKPCSVGADFNFGSEGVYQPDYRNRGYYDREWLTFSPRVSAEILVSIVVPGSGWFSIGFNIEPTGAASPLY